MYSKTPLVAMTAAVLALTLSACSDEPDNPDQTTTTSSESTASQSPAPQPKDRSKQVFDAYTDQTKVLASTSGKVKSGPPGLPPQPVTFEVTGLEATADATILEYQLTADESTQLGIKGLD